MKRSIALYLAALLLILSIIPCLAEGQETEAATSIVVEVDLSSLETSISGLSADIQDLNAAVSSMAEVQESLLVECNELQAASVKSTDSAAVAILIFIGIILSFSITLWLFRK